MLRVLRARPQVRQERNSPMSDCKIRDSHEHVYDLAAVTKPSSMMGMSTPSMTSTYTTLTMDISMRTSSPNAPSTHK